jgi:vanillate O-demethylase monooxygenase subunit
MTVRKIANYVQPPYLVDWFTYKTVDRHHTHCMMSPAVTRVVMRVANPGELQRPQRARRISRHAGGHRQ